MVALTYNIHDPTLQSLAQQAEPVIGRELNLPLAQAIWEEARDPRARRVAVLHVRESPGSGEASAAFAPDELQNESQMTHRLHDLRAAVIRVGEYRNRIEWLYDQIPQWLADPAVNYQRTRKVLNELRSGKYALDCFEGVANGQRIFFCEPMGTWIVGADGRIDVASRDGRDILVLVGARWHVVPDDRNTWDELTPDRFRNMVSG